MATTTTKIKYSTGKQSIYPAGIDSFDIYANDTDTISSTGMNRMSASLLNLEKDLIGAPAMLSGDMVVSACTATLSAIQFNTEYTLTFASSSAATSAFTAAIGQSRIGAGKSAMLLVDARPTSANFGNGGILDTALDYQTNVKETYPVIASSRTWTVKNSSGGLVFSTGTLNGLRSQRFRWTGTPPSNTVVATSVVELTGTTTLSHYSLLETYLSAVTGTAWGNGAFEFILYSDLNATVEVGRVTLPTSGMYPPNWAGAGGNDYTSMIPASIARTNAQVKSIALATKTGLPSNFGFDMCWVNLMNETTHFPPYSLSWRWDTSALVPTICFKLMPGPTTAFLMTGDSGHDQINEVILSVVGLLPS